MQSGTGADARSAEEFWKENFAGKARAEEPGEQEEKSGPPLKVEGLGDEALWMGNDRMGALYVLKGNRILRISVGGAGDQAAKIEKSRTLAEAALKRM